ncbi:helix-turn-helix transcriptional regulator [Pseudooceanicola sp. 502str34]
MGVFLTDKQVGERYGVSRVTIWRWKKTDPTFPNPVNLSPGCVRFRISDLEAWEASKANVAEAEV